MKNKLKQVGFFLLIMLFTQSLWAQINISGKIVDQKDKEAIIGASVIVKGTSLGTVTDHNGDFSLSVPSGGVLKISYLGYETQEIPIAGKSFFDILLKEAINEMDEIVVVGYGVQRKSDLTGAVSSVKMSDAIRSTPTSNISSALQGRLAGVSIVSSSGQPGSSSTIRIRGMNSLQADGGPLLVIDGLIGGTLESLNPSDIQSIEVLKDASATAVYGSRGANGVILVTTKNPEEGKNTISYSGYMNIKTPYSLPKVMSAGEFADLANAFGQEFYPTPREFYTPDQVAAFYVGEDGYDYIDNIFRDAAIEHTHEISISGGNNKTNFLLSGNYSDNRGIVNNSYSKRANYRLKVDSDIRSWLRFGANFWGDWYKSEGPRFSQYNNLLIHGLTFPTTIMPKDPETGDYNNMNLIGPQYNPMLFVNEIDRDGDSFNSRLQAYMDVALAKGLTFRMTHGFMFGRTESFITYKKGSYDYYQNYNNKTAATAQVSTGYSWTNTNVLSYMKEFNKDHRINATAVFEQMLNRQSLVRATGSGGLLSDDIGGYNVTYARNLTGASSVTRNTMMSYLGRINYVLMNRYMMTASWRRDGSSLLAHKNRWDQFPSMAVAWNIREESFMENSFLDQFKLRFGYGVTGNQSVPIYSAYSRNIASYNDLGELVVILDSKNIGNEDLRWEKTSQYNVGLDFGLFNNRLTFNIDAYHKKTTDVLLDVNTPIYTGTTTRLQNAGTILNKGIEITVGADPYVSSGFNWNTTVILSTNVGKVHRLAQDKQFADLGGAYEQGYYRNIVGEKIATMWGYKCLGVWTTEEIEELQATMSSSDFAKMNIEPGAYKYEDLDGVPGITADDKQIIGNGQPTFNWSWNNTINYKEFDFSLLLIGVHGFDIYNYTREARLMQQQLTPTSELNNRWTSENQNTNIAGFVPLSNKQTPSSMFVEKGDFVKVKSITLGYTIPSKLLNKYGIRLLRVYTSVQNPFLFTKYDGIDPEVTLRTPLTSGMDWGYYPNGRNFMLGLNLQF